MAVEIERFCSPAYVIDENAQKVADVRARMADALSGDQLRELDGVLRNVFCDGNRNGGFGFDQAIPAFVAAKAVEGLSERSLSYYSCVLRKFAAHVGKPADSVSSNDCRNYIGSLAIGGCKGTTCDNERRVLSSFYTWMEDDEYIPRSPMRKVKAIKKRTSVKPPFTDVELEKLKQACTCDRDRAIVELFDSSGMRLSELVGLNRSDVELAAMRCKVLGKGSKERICYFNDVCAMYLGRYLSSRTDGNSALFISKQKRNGVFNRVSQSAVELMIRNLGRTSGVDGAHPHRFRRTMATRNLRRGMNVENIQQLLGHESINTTMIYAQVDKSIVENEARRLMG